MILDKIEYQINTQLYLKVLKSKLIHNIVSYKPLLKNIINQYKEQNIYRAVDTIYIDGQIIFCPTGGIYGQILRALEYGTSSTKAYHLISQTNKNLLKEVRNESIVKL